MTRPVPMAVCKADPDADPCPACSQPIVAGQRIALVRHDDLGHAWIHVRHLVEQLLAELAAPEAAS
jgi:hypothetical protein